MLWLWYYWPDSRCAREDEGNVYTVVVIITHKLYLSENLKNMCQNGTPLLYQPHTPTPTPTHTWHSHSPISSPHTHTHTNTHMAQPLSYIIPTHPHLHQHTHGTATLLYHPHTPTHTPMHTWHSHTFHLFYIIFTHLYICISYTS